MSVAPLAVPFGRPWYGEREREAALAVLEQPILTHGPRCQAFERDFAAFVGEGAHCLSVSSCMAALHLSYLGLGIGPGDEVLVPAQTHVATAHAVEAVGARPVFVDCDPDTGNVDSAALEAAVGPRTRAISVVHFLGIPCDMDRVAEIARRHDLRLVEDCALALGSRWDGTHVGLYGDAGCFSFYPVKHITTGEGGMLVTRDAELLERARKLRGFGVDRDHQSRAIPGMYDVPGFGLNYRMSEIAAALGSAQMARVEENLDRRRANFTALRERLAGLPGVRVLDARSAQARNSHYCLGLVLDAPLAARREDLLLRLVEAGVGCSVYYPSPVPRMTYYRQRYGYDARRFAQAERISDGSIALPVGPHLGAKEITYVADVVCQLVEEISA